MPYTPLELAEAFIKAGELTDALDALNDHLRAHPDDAEQRRVRAQVRLRLNTPEHLAAALDDLPGGAEDDYTRSVILERLGRLPDALDAAEQAHTTATADFRARALERVLDLLRKTGAVERALALALENDWLQWAADAAADLNDAQAALGYYSQALERVDKLAGVVAPEIAANIRARVLLKRAAVQRTLGEHQAAANDYHAAAAIIPDDPMIPFNLGLIAADTGKAEDALAQMQSAYQSAPAALQARMRAELTGKPAYAGLLAALITPDPPQD